MQEPGIEINGGNIPKDIINKITQYLEPKEAARFAQSSKGIANAVNNLPYNKWKTFKDCFDVEKEIKNIESTQQYKFL